MQLMSDDDDADSDEEEEGDELLDGAEGLIDDSDLAASSSADSDDSDGLGMRHYHHET